MYRVLSFGIVYVSIYTIHDVFVYRVPNSAPNPLKGALRGPRKTEVPAKAFTRL